MKLARAIVGLWILLFFLFLPFPYSVFPNFGEGLSKLIFPIIKWSGHLIGQEISSANFYSDSIQLYLQLIFTLVLSPLIFIGISRWKTLTTEKLNNFLYIASTYILAFFLLKYGLDKIFKYQFYDAAPNTLYTPVGYLSKDILFWTSMGSSHSYNVFMGLIEVVPGILLFWNRTRVLGALIAFGVLANVLAINFGFDITVKLLSGMLVATSLYILEPHSKRLWAFFVQNTFARIDLQETLIKNSTLKRAFKGFVVALIIIETLLSYITAEAWNADNLPKIDYYGSYSVINNVGSSTVINLTEIKRVHIHNLGYFILEDHDGNFKDFIAEISHGSNTIKLVDSNLTLHVLNDKNGFSFISNSDGNQFRLTVQQIDLKNLPYHFDSFHWTVESFTSE